MLPRPTIAAFDVWLSDRSLRLEAVVVGGSALALLGVMDRQTRDFDILYPELPADCVALEPSAAELEEAEPWLSNQDTNPMWPDHVRATLDDLRRRLGHGV